MEPLPIPYLGERGLQKRTYAWWHRRRVMDSFGRSRPGITSCFGHISPRLNLSNTLFSFRLMIKSRRHLPYDCLISLLVSLSDERRLRSPRWGATESSAPRLHLVHPRPSTMRSSAFRAALTQAAKGTDICATGCFGIAISTAPSRSKVQCA